jgi:PadR family transcriptional regulator
MNGISRRERKMMSKEKTDPFRGTLDMLIHKVVAVDPVHGYEVSERIRLISRDLLNVQKSLLLSALHRLEIRGLVTAEWGESENRRHAKFYRLSAKGREQMAIEEAGWNRFVEAITLIVIAPHQDV